MQQYGTIVFNYKGRTERDHDAAPSRTSRTASSRSCPASSGRSTSRRVTARRTRRSAERDGYNTIADALKRENYTVDKVVLAQPGAVPDDAAMVVVAGPKTDFFPPEVDALKKYLGKRGKLLLMLDPPAAGGRAGRCPT